MGAAACKTSKSSLPNQPKNDIKNITIGVFGLDDAGKTSTVKVIEGGSTKNIIPTIGSVSTMVPNPLKEKNDHNDRNKNQQRIKIIDVSGERKFRQKSWSQYYDQIHGLIFVIDASEKERINENQETLEDLLKDEKLKDKPILILANKQDQRGAISNERDLKRQLELERLKTKHKIELCTASPQNLKNKNDDSIRKGFSWLIQTIDDNYTSLNARVTKAKNAPITKRSNRSESDENDSDNKYSKDKNRSRLTSEKLPSINKNTSKAYSDDDDDIYSSSKNDFNKNKKVVGATNNNDRSIKKSNDNEPKAFRSTFEPFPDETLGSLSSMLKPTKSDDTLPRVYGKPPLSSDTKRRGVSPLVHDTKPYTNGSTFKRNNNSDGEDDYMRQQKLKTTGRFDNSTSLTNRFAMNTKKPTGNIYDDDNNNTRRIVTTSKKTYNDDDDDDDDIYPKKSTTTTTKLNKNYDFDDNRTHQRSNFNSDYRGTSSKPGNQFKYDNDNRSSSSFPKKDTHSRFNDDDDDDDYPTSKPKNRPKYSDDDDDDNRWSSSKTATNSKYDKDDYPSSSSKFTNRSKYDNEDRPFSSSKPISHSKFEDDDYPTSKSATRSNYNNYNSSKSTGHSKYDDDDDDDYPSSTKKTNYPSSYGSRATGSRFDDDDFYK